MKTFLWFALAISMTLSLCPARAAAETLKVLNWNVYMLPWPIKDSMQRERSKVIAAALEKTDYDLIFLEEAFSNGFRKEIHKVVTRKYPYSFYLKSDGKIKHVFGSGLLVLSRKPFHVLDHVYFDKCASADCFAAKGSVLIETTLASGRTMQIASTHLQAIDGQGAKRMLQLAMINKLLKRNLRPGIPQMLIGDLNIDPREPEFLKGLSLLKMKPAILTGPITYTSGRDSLCFNVPHDGTTWIDHAWAKPSEVGAIASRVREYSFESKGRLCPDSDHHAVEIRAELL